MATKIEDFPERAPDDMWEMNIHQNPIEEDVADALKRHQAMMQGYSCDFVQLIEHTE